MSKKAIKFDNDIYLDSTEIVDSRVLLDEKLNGTTLYENSSGTQEDFSLNDDIGNYKKIEVYIKEGSTATSFPHIYTFFVNDSGTVPYASISLEYVATTPSLVVRNLIYTFSGTTATVNRIYTATMKSGSGTFTTTVSLYVWKVIGYK